MIRLTDHELEKAIHKEKKKASARRLAEVQEQSKTLSKKILDSRRNYKKTLLDCIVKELVIEDEEVRKVEEKEMCRRIKASFEEMGSAHKAAESEPDYKEIRDKRLEGFHKVTKVRGKIAAKVSEDIKRKTEEEREYPRRLKREVRSLEDLRAAYLVSEFKEAEPKKRGSSRDKKKKPEGVLVFDRKNLHQYVSNRPRNFVSKSSPRPNAIEKAKKCCEDEEKRRIEKEENRKIAEERGKRALKSQAVKRQYLKMVEALSNVELESDWDITPLGQPSRSVNKISESPAIDLHTGLEATKGAEQTQELSITNYPDVDPDMSYPDDKRIIHTETTVKDDVLCTTPEFSQPLMVDVPCPKKLCDSYYLKHAQNVLEQLKQKRKELEEEFENVSLVAMPSHPLNCCDIRNEEEEEMNLSECHDLVEKIKNLKKDLLSHDAFDNVLESAQKSKDSVTLESTTSNLTTSTSYLDLPLTLTRGKDKQSSVYSFTSTEYKNLPDNVPMAFPRR